MKLTQFVQNDALYFPRTTLANQLLISLRDGISHALTLFAPRRMGKTQFLLNDVAPLANKMGFEVFYFSFMADDKDAIKHEFISALTDFLAQISNNSSRAKEFIASFRSINLFGLSVELQDKEKSEKQGTGLTKLFDEMSAATDKPILLLLDEIQELAKIKNSDGLIRALRTALDIHQRKVKVIFTGSSTNGLRVMFNNNKAPFFHFAHALDFPHLGQEFTDFLADIYQQRTNNALDKAEFYRLFERLNFTPLYMRAIAQELIINPALSLEQVAESKLAQMNEQSDNEKLWQGLSEIEKRLLVSIAEGEARLYSAEYRHRLASEIGIEQISSSAIQGQLKKLERKELLTRSVDDSMQINNSHFRTWLLEKIDN